VTDLVPDVLRHRLVLSYEALAEGLTSDHLIANLLKKVRAPARVLQSHARAAAAVGS
jgi:MoxR-like ATPase